MATVNIRRIIPPYRSRWYAFDLHLFDAWPWPHFTQKVFRLPFIDLSRRCNDQLAIPYWTLETYFDRRCAASRCRACTDSCRSCSPRSRRSCTGTWALQSAPSWPNTGQRSRPTSWHPSLSASRETSLSWWSRWGTWCSTLWWPEPRYRHLGLGRRSTRPSSLCSEECPALPY